MAQLDVALYTKLVEAIGEQTRLLKSINIKLAKQLAIMEGEEEEEEEEEDSSDSAKKEDEDEIGMKTIFKAAGKKLKDKVVGRMIPDSAPSTSPKE